MKHQRSVKKRLQGTNSDALLPIAYKYLSILKDNMSYAGLSQSVLRKVFDKFSIQVSSIFGLDQINITVKEEEEEKLQEEQEKKINLGRVLIVYAAEGFIKGISFYEGNLSKTSIKLPETWAYVDRIFIDVNDPTLILCKARTKTYYYETLKIRVYLQNKELVMKFEGDINPYRRERWFILKDALTIYNENNPYRYVGNVGAFKCTSDGIFQGAIDFAETLVYGNIGWATGDQTGECASLHPHYYVSYWNRAELEVEAQYYMGVQYAKRVSSCSGGYVVDGVFYIPYKYHKNFDWLNYKNNYDIYSVLRFEKDFNEVLNSEFNIDNITNEYNFLTNGREKITIVKEEHLDINTIKAKLGAPPQLPERLDIYVDSWSELCYFEYLGEHNCIIDGRVDHLAPRTYVGYAPPLQNISHSIVKLNCEPEECMCVLDDTRVITFGRSAKFGLGDKIAKALDFRDAIYIESHFIEQNNITDEYMYIHAYEVQFPEYPSSLPTIDIRNGIFPPPCAPIMVISDNPYRVKVWPEIYTENAPFRIDIDYADERILVATNPFASDNKPKTVVIFFDDISIEAQTRSNPRPIYGTFECSLHGLPDTDFSFCVSNSDQKDKPVYRFSKWDEYGGYTIPKWLKNQEYEDGYLYLPDGTAIRIASNENGKFIEGLYAFKNNKAKIKILDFSDENIPLYNDYIDVEDYPINACSAKIIYISDAFLEKSKGTF